MPFKPQRSVLLDNWTPLIRAKFGHIDDDEVDWQFESFPESFLSEAAMRRCGFKCLFLVSITSFLVQACGGSEDDSAARAHSSASLSVTESEAGVELSWSAAMSNVSGYEIARNGVVIRVLPAGETGYVDTSADASTAYSYELVALDADNARVSSMRSNYVTLSWAQRDRRPPSVPTAVSATAVGPTLVRVSWHASTDNVSVVKYQVWRDEVLIAEVAGVTAYADGTVEADSAYTYEVTAVDRAENVSDLSRPVDVKTPTATDSTAPSAPASLTVAAVASTRVNLSWSASTDNVGVVKYRILRGGALLAETTATNYADTSVAANMTYSYQTRAVDAAGNLSTASNTVTVSTPSIADMAAPTVPENVLATVANATRVNLSWSASSDNVGVTNYQVFRSGTSAALAEPTGVEYADTTVTAGATYSYRVRAVDAAGNASALSATASVSMPAEVDNISPSTPGTLSAVVASAGRVNLSWIASTDNVGVVKYRVFRNGSTTALAEAPGTAYADTSVSPASTYTYQVSAVEAVGNVSTLSNNAQAVTPAASDTTAPTVPGPLSATAVSASQINLTWRASTDSVGVAGYRIYRDGGNTPIGTAQGSSYSDSMVVASTTYSYQVRAFDAAGNSSAPSNSASVSTPAAGTPPAWKPLTPGTSWQWQIDGNTINESVLDGVSNGRKMYDIDLENTDAATISRLKAKGIYVVCYIEVGSYNTARDDAYKFTEVPGLIGNRMAGFPGESWVDLRRTDALMPIMNARLDKAQAKGCDGIEPDLDDSYTESTGFPLTQDHSINYLTLLVQAAHARGLSMGLKNGPDMASRAAPIVDWALNEECNQYSECDGYKEFIKLNKAVFQVEYTSNGSTPASFCAKDNAANFDGLLKKSSETLGALPRTACRFE